MGISNKNNGHRQTEGENKTGNRGGTIIRRSWKVCEFGANDWHKMENLLKNTKVNRNSFCSIWKSTEIVERWTLKIRNKNNFIQNISNTSSAECWTLKKEDERSRLVVAEMKWFRGISKISRRQRIHNGKKEENN